MVNEYDIYTDAGEISEEEANQSFEEGHMYAVIDDFEQLIIKHGVEFILDHMTAEGVTLLKEAFLGHAG